MSGRTYSVEYKNSLSETNWTPLGSDLVAAGSSASLTDPLGTNTQRIYRIVLPP